ncbi:MAG: 2-dehydro-3-deoxygalactonokinase, partial [Boseongicola sp.]
MSVSTQANWIAVDWGTSNLRAWAMHDDRPIAAASTDDGMGSLDKSEFEPVLSAA